VGKTLVVGDGFLWGMGDLTVDVLLEGEPLVLSPGKTSLLKPVHFFAPKDCVHSR
jgi:hypothetical protein